MNLGPPSRYRRQRISVISPRALSIGTRYVNKRGAASSRSDSGTNGRFSARRREETRPSIMNDKDDRASPSSSRGGTPVQSVIPKNRYLPGRPHTQTAKPRRRFRVLKHMIRSQRSFGFAQPKPTSSRGRHYFVYFAGFSRDFHSIGQSGSLLFRRYALTLFRQIIWLP